MFYLQIYVGNSLNTCGFHYFCGVMRRIIAIFFVLLLVSTNVGLAFGTHFCGGFSMDTKLITTHDDLTCGMEFMDRACELDDEHTVIKKSCCSNEVHSLQIEEEFAQSAVPDIPIVQTAILISLLVPEFYPEESEAPRYSSDESPPWKPADIHIYLQTFLI
jgi:hypothetical protein